MKSSLSQSTTAHNVALSQVDDLLQGRTFDIASQEQIDTTGNEVLELILNSRDVLRSLILASRMLFEGAIRNTEYSRSVSFVAEEVYSRLRNEDKEVACDFQYELENLVVGEFTRAWKDATEDNSKNALHESWPQVSPQYLETNRHLKDLSIVVSDFYAMGFVSPRAFQKAVEVIVERFPQRDHLICLIIMLSRANSHRGKSFAHTWYLDLVWQIRTRCTDYLGDIEPKEEESCLVRLVRGLISDLNENGESSRYCKIAVSYCVIEEWDTEVMIAKAWNEIDELYLLDTRATGKEPLDEDDSDSDCPGSPPPAITSVDLTQDAGNNEPVVYDSPEEEMEEKASETLPKKILQPTTNTDIHWSAQKQSNNSASSSSSPATHPKESSVFSGPNFNCQTPLRRSTSANCWVHEVAPTPGNFKSELRLHPAPATAPRVALRRPFNPQGAKASTNILSKSPAQGGVELRPPHLSNLAKPEEPHDEMRLSDLTTTLKSDWSL